jgi:ERCC4-related helicase
VQNTITLVRLFYGVGFVDDEIFKLKKKLGISVMKLKVKREIIQKKIKNETTIQIPTRIIIFLNYSQQYTTIFDYLFLKG